MPLSTNEPPAPLMVAPTIHHRAIQQAFCDISLVIEAAREQPVHFLSVGTLLLALQGGLSPTWSKLPATTARQSVITAI